MIKTVQQEKLKTTAAIRLRTGIINYGTISGRPCHSHSGKTQSMTINILLRYISLFPHNKINYTTLENKKKKHPIHITKSAERFPTEKNLCENI